MYMSLCSSSTSFDVTSKNKGHGSPVVKECPSVTGVRSGMGMVKIDPVFSISCSNEKDLP